MQVERRHHFIRSTACDDVEFRALELLKQANEWGLAFEDDPRGSGLHAHERQIAQELQRVAQTLVGVNEDRSAQYGLAVPPGRGKVADAVRVSGTTPKPLVFGPPCFIAAEKEQHDAEVEMRLGEIRTAGEGVAIAGLRRMKI